MLSGMDGCIKTSDMKKILCIGEALIDMICTDKGKSLSEGNNFLKKAGGAPANVAAAIAALGGDVALVAKIGLDPFGKHLVNTLREFKVNTRWMIVDPKYFTTLAFVSLMENGERDFYFNRGADGELSLEDIEAINVDEYAIIHFGSATAFLPGPLQAAYTGLLEKAMKQNIFISFDPNYRTLLFQHNQKCFIEQCWNFIDSCQFFKMSDEEAMLITGKDSVYDAAMMLLDRTKSVFAITLGKGGAMARVRDQTVIIPSIPVLPIDTTGAGDAFVGAVLYQLGELTISIDDIDETQWNLIFANANKAGARTCEYMGAMEAFKHLSSDIFS
jgi:fructokinase